MLIVETGRGHYFGRQRMQTQFRRPDDAPDASRTEPIVLEKKKCAVETSSGTTTVSLTVVNISYGSLNIQQQRVRLPIFKVICSFRDLSKSLFYRSESQDSDRRWGNGLRQKHSNATVPARDHRRTHDWSYAAEETRYHHGNGFLQSLLGPLIAYLESSFSLSPFPTLFHPKGE